MPKSGSKALQCKENKPSICALLLSRQYARRVNDGDTFQYGVRQVGALEAVQECVAKLGERSELFLWVDDQSVTRYDTLSVTIHHRYETIGRRLGTDP